MSSDQRKQTPLNRTHRDLGARMVDFGGWDMPVHYSSQLEEHHAVRKNCGLFDVSHMGETRVKGANALDLLQHLTPNDVARLEPGDIQYSGLMTEQATFVDDTLIYRLEDDEYLLIPNASNIEKDTAWIQQHAGANVEVSNLSDQYALLALQGPKAPQVLERVGSGDGPKLAGFKFTWQEVAGKRALVSRTGYTGEDGFEIFVAPGDAEDVFHAILDEGKADEIRPCGLGARDTLRLEAKLPLYGNDIDETTTPLEAGLNFIVKLKKGPFLGSEVLQEQRKSGLKRKLVGFAMRERGIARHGYPVYKGSDQLGVVTSGAPAPSLDERIGLCYLPIEFTQPGQQIEIEVRGKRIAAEVVKTPFYRRAQS